MEKKNTNDTKQIKTNGTKQNGMVKGVVGTLREWNTFKYIKGWCVEDKLYLPDNSHRWFRTRSEGILTAVFLIWESADDVAGINKPQELQK